MDIANRFDAGGSIANLMQQRTTEAETSFNELMDSINTKATDEDTLFGTIQKAGASVTAVGAIAKGTFQGIMKLKNSISGNNSKKEGGDDDAEDESETGTEMDTYQTAPRQPSETQEAGDSTEADAEEPTEDVGLFDEDNLADNMGNVNFADEGLDPIAESAGDTDAPLFGEDTDLPGAGGEVEGEDAGEFTGIEGGEEGGEVAGDLGETTVSTAQTAGGLLNATGATRDVPSESTFEAEDVGADVGEEVGEDAVDLGADATLDAAANGATSIGNAISGLVSSATNAIGDVAGTASDVVSGISSAVSAASGAIDATTGAVAGAVDTAAVVGEVAGSAALEAAGTALDATGVGAPIGLILNIIGGLVLGGTMTAGIVGEVDAGNEQTDATAQANQTLKNATSGAVAGIAGRYGV